jgi:hypothetical protein
MLEQLTLDGVRGVIEAHKHQYFPKTNVLKLDTSSIQTVQVPTP